MKPITKRAAASNPSLLIALPASERGLAPIHVQRYEKAKAILLAQAKTLTDEQKDGYLATMLSVANGPKDLAHKEWLETSTAETAALAAGRGETVLIKPDRSVRIMSRGGLRQSYEEGHLDHAHGSLRADDLYDWGKRYRDAYESSEGMTTGDRTTSGFGPRAPQVKKLEAALELKAMRAQLSDRQIAVLDLVCGQDMRLRAAATQLRRGFPSAKNSLRGGLAALVGLKIERDAGLAERLRIKTAAITAAQNAA